ncbi:MAG: trigger factor, partial [Thermorudis peleae]|nr:trigger factor [Thermorudis peleae]
LPPALIDREVEHELEHLRQRLREQNSSLEEYLRLREQTLDDLRAELRPQAERRLRQFLALDAFAKAEGLAVTEDDLAAEIERLSAGSENPEQARAIYQSPYFRDFLLDELQSRKVTEQLLAIVTEGRGPVVGEAARFLEPAEAAAEPAAEEAADSEAAATAEDAAESAATAEDAAADMAATDQQPLDEQAEPVPVAASEPAAEPEAASDAPAHDQSHEEGV